MLNQKRRNVCFEKCFSEIFCDSNLFNEILTRNWYDAEKKPFTKQSVKKSKVKNSHNNHHHKNLIILSCDVFNFHLHSFCCKIIGERCGIF